MKKLFTILMLCFAVFAVNAQFILQEDFENGLPTGWTNIDNDGDTYSWDADYWPALGDFGNNESAGVIASASYINDIGALHPDNWLITPAIALEAGSASILNFYAGNYGYDEPLEVLVSTTGATVAAFTDPAIASYNVTNDVTEDGYTQYSVNLSAYAGQTIYIAFVHRNCTDNYWLFLDDITIESITTPELTVNPDNIDFGTVMLGFSQTMTSSVAGYLLSGAITATTAAPFEVSADGTTFGSSVSLNADGGTLYVKYTPTEAGTDNGTVTVTSGELTETITLSGSAFSCDGYTIPYSYDFEDASLGQCWIIEDANNDNHVFTIQGGYAAINYNSSIPHDDWLISPEFPLTGNEYVSFDYKGSASYPEKFQVYVIQGTTRTLVQDTTLANTGSYQNAIIDLSAYTGATRVGIHCVSDRDELSFYVDNFVVDVPEPTLTVAPDSIDFAVIEVGTTREAEATLTALAITEAITLTAPASFAVSVDGTNYATTATIPASTGLAATYTVYVQYAPTAAGVQSGNVVISSGELTANIFVTGEGHLCENITSLPFTDNFDLNTIPPMCWTTTDETLLGNGTVDEEGTDAVTLLGATGAIIISPEIEANTNPMWAAFDYVTYAGFNESVSVSPSTFRVGYSTTTNDYNAFTWGETVTAVDDVDFINYREFIPAGAKYVAIEGNSIGTFLLYGFFEYDNWLIINNFTLTEAEPEIVANPATIDFGGIEVGSTATEDATITGVMLTDSISVTTTAPFAISLDGTAFTTEIAMAPAGATLYVQYAPTAAGTANGTVTLTSGTISATITLNGSAVVCDVISEFPYTCTFAAGSEDLYCWETVDVNGDANVEGEYRGSCFFNGEFSTENDGIAQYFYSEFNDADDWFISPAFALTENMRAKFDYFVANEGYPEIFGVYVIPQGQTYQNAVEVVAPQTVDNTDPMEQVVDLSAYANQTVRIGIHVTSEADDWYIAFDNFVVEQTNGVEENEASFVRVFPNPATNMINVEAQGYEQYQLVNMLGQTVSSNSLNNGTAQINVSNLSNGVYFVRLINGNNVETIKVVKK